MPKARRIEVRIRGVSDMLQNRRPPKSEEEKESNRRSGEIDHSKDWEKATYRNKDGCYIPSKHIEASLTESGKDFKIKGIRGGRKGYQDRMKAAVIVEPDEIPFSPPKKKPDRIHEDWGKIPPRTGSMVWICRPCYNKGWEAEFDLLVLDDQIPLTTLKDILINSGQFIAIGDWIPKFGRFEVIEFNENKGRPRKR